MFQKSPISSPIASATLVALMLLAHPAFAMEKMDYNIAKSNIKAAYKTSKAACASQSGNAKDVCVQEAKGKEAVDLAELEFAYTQKPADATKARTIQAKATYAIQKEKCDDLAGNPKDVCVKEAKAVEVKALAEATMTADIRKAKVDAATDVRAADQKLALEKCDALAGDPKAKCVDAAKLQFPKK